MKYCQTGHQRSHIKKYALRRFPSKIKGNPFSIYYHYYWQKDKCAKKITFTTSNHKVEKDRKNTRLRNSSISRTFFCSKNNISIGMCIFQKCFCYIEVIL